MNQLKKIFKRDFVRGVMDVTFEKDKLCGASQAKKQVANTHLRRTSCQPQDPWNSFTWTSLDQPLTRYTWVFFLQEKSKTMGIFKKFAERAQNEFGNPIVKIRNDNGMEFKNSHIDDYCDKHGIKHKLSSTSTPEQNGFVERKNKTLISLARTMLDEYGTSKRFWAKAINTAYYASNRLYLHRLLKNTHISSWLEGSQMYHTSESLVASVISIRRDNTLESSKRDVILDS